MPLIGADVDGRADGSGDAVPVWHPLRPPEKVPERIPLFGRLDVCLCQRDFVVEQASCVRGPVLFGIDAGHGTENLTLPLGVRVRLAGARARLAMVESAVR